MSREKCDWLKSSMTRLLIFMAQKTYQIKNKITPTIKAVGEGKKNYLEIFGILCSHVISEQKQLISLLKLFPS